MIREGLLALPELAFEWLHLLFMVTCTCFLHLHLMLSLFEDASRHELPGCTCSLHLYLMLSLFEDAFFSLEPDFSASYIGEILI